MAITVDTIQLLYYKPVISRIALVRRCLTCGLPQVRHLRTIGEQKFNVKPSYEQQEIQKMNADLKQDEANYDLDF